MGSVGDPDKLLAVRLYFRRTKNGQRKECVVTQYPTEKKTTIILDFGKWTYSNPTMELPYLIPNLTPKNIASKVRKIMLFS